MKANEILRNRRMEIGLSQKEVARRTGIPQASICRYELGQNKLSNENAKKLTDFYNLNYKFLTGEKRMHVKKQNAEKKYNEINDLRRDLFKKFDEIYNEELKKFKVEALRKTYKRLKKEL